MTRLSVRSICFTDVRQLRRIQRDSANLLPPLRISLLLQLKYFLPDLESNWELKLRTQAHILAKALCKLLRRIVRVVYVPLELVPVHNTTHAHVQLNNPDLFKVDSLELSTSDRCRHLRCHDLIALEVLYLFFHLLNDVCFEDGAQILLVDE